MQNLVFYSSLQFVHIQAACRRERDVVSHLCSCKEICGPVQYLGLNIRTLIELDGWKKTS